MLADEKPRRGRKQKEELQDMAPEQVTDQDFEQAVEQVTDQAKRQKQTACSKKPASLTKVVLLKNIKYKGKRYKIGQTIEIDAKMKSRFVQAGIVRG